MHSVISHPPALYKGWDLIFYIILWCSLDEDTWINYSHHGPSPLLIVCLSNYQVVTYKLAEHRSAAFTSTVLSQTTLIVLRIELHLNIS